MAGFSSTNTGFSIELKGLDQLIRGMNRKILRMEQSILRKAVQAFAEPIRADIERRARAAVSPRVQIKTEIRIRGSSASVKIGPVGEFFWLFFWEYGYWIRLERKGAKIKWMPPRPSVVPAYEAYKEMGLAAMEKILVDAFSEEIPIAA